MDKDRKKYIQHLEKYIEVMPDALVVVDKDLKMIKINKAFEIIWGYAWDELAGKNVFMIVSEREVEANKKKMQELIEKGKDVVVFETIAKKKNGQEIPVLNHGVLLRDEKGNPDGFFGVFIDISDIRVAKEKLKESEQRFESIFNNVSDGIVLVSQKGIILEANQELLDLFGVDKKDVMGKHIKSLLKGIAPKSMLVILKNFGKRILGAKIKPYEIEILHPQRGKIIIELSATSYKIDKEIKGVISLARDVTDRKRSEDDILKSKEETEKFNKLAVGREMKMIELKKETNSLLKELGRDPKY